MCTCTMCSGAEMREFALCDEGMCILMEGEFTVRSHVCKQFCEPGFAGVLWGADLHIKLMRAWRDIRRARQRSKRASSAQGWGSPPQAEAA